MAKVFDAIDSTLREFIVSQPVFFVATAPLTSDGLVNCSPKGNRGEFAVTGDHEVAYLDQTGSGVETIAHLKENGRIVVMFCAFSGPPRIVRLHGRGRVLVEGDADYERVSAPFEGRSGVGVRSVIVVDVARISDSCGYGVPLMEFQSHRPTMDQWSARKGREGVREYWRTTNATSLDGLEGL